VQWWHLVKPDQVWGLYLWWKKANRSKQLVMQAFLGRQSHLPSDCAQFTSKYISSDWFHHQTHFRRVIRWHPWTWTSLRLFGMKFLIPHDSASRSFSGCRLFTCFKCWVIGWCIQLSLGNPFSPIPDEWQWNKSCGTKLDWLDSEMSLLLIYRALSSPLSSTWVAASVIISGLIQENAFHWPSIGEF